ncbi:hypothetical protein ScalyP_jg1425 [Parmales sp. scaly parma]|nr:hypothetical protein ScalyP_jg1425 [Parmales sp. scaly parma]
MNSSLKHYNQKRVVKYFERWHFTTTSHKRESENKLQLLKIGSEWTKIHAEKLKHTQMEADNKRRLAEKLCLMYLSKQKQKMAERRIANCQAEANAEKEQLTAALRGMYIQLTKLNVLEEQAVEAAKTRGTEHLTMLESTSNVLQKANLK